jgi:hypothetical protein
MKVFVFVVMTFLFFSTNSFSQKTGKVFYQNIDSVNKTVEEFKKLGLQMSFAPSKINLEHFPHVQNVLFGYKKFFETWYRQVNEIIFLDYDSFSSLSKNGMILQDIIYIQEKNTDYKWDGEKNFELPHVFSKIFFTASVTEYSDKFVLNIKVAEKRKN